MAEREWKPWQAKPWKPGDKFVQHAHEKAEDGVIDGETCIIGALLNIEWQLNRIAGALTEDDGVRGSLRDITDELENVAASMPIVDGSEIKVDR